MVGEVAGAAKSDSWEPGLPLPMSVQPPFLLPVALLVFLRIALPHWQSSWVGQSGAVSCSAKDQAYDPRQASQTFFRELESQGPRIPARAELS